MPSIGRGGGVVVGRPKLNDKDRCASRYLRRDGKVVRCSIRRDVTHDRHINEAPGRECVWSDERAHQGDSDG
jgi:hypothetical protein